MKHNIELILAYTFIIKKIIVIEMNMIGLKNIFQKYL